MKLINTTVLEKRWSNWNTLPSNSVNKMSSSVDINIIKSPINSHINVSLQDFMCLGYETFDCFHCGLAFYDINRIDLTVISKITKICSSTPVNWMNLQNVYSSNERMLIVGYSYKNYGLLKFSLVINWTLCQPVLVHNCKNSIIHIDIPIAACLILQVGKYSENMFTNVIHSFCFTAIKLKTTMHPGFFLFDFKGYLSGSWQAIVIITSKCNILYWGDIFLKQLKRDKWPFQNRLE